MASIRPLPRPSWGSIHNNNRPAVSFKANPLPCRKNRARAWQSPHRTSKKRPNSLLRRPRTSLASCRTSCMCWGPLFNGVHAVTALSGLFCFSSSWRVPGKRVTARPRGTPPGLLEQNSGLRRRHTLLFFFFLYFSTHNYDPGHPFQKGGSSWSSWSTLRERNPRVFKTANKRAY